MRGNNMRHELGYKELLWLTTRGGRDENDVLWDKYDRPYVYMYSGNMREEVKVFLPEAKYIHFEMGLEGRVKSYNPITDKKYHNLLKDIHMPR